MTKDNLNSMKTFIISIVVFVIVLGFCCFLYYKYQEPLDMKANKDAVNIEVSLPVLEWTKYTSLNKDFVIKDAGKVLGIKRVRTRVPASDATEQIIRVE